MSSYYTKEQDEKFLDSLDKRFASASVFLETDDGKLMVVKALYKNYWSLPGGVIDAGESPLEAACRETREEVAIVLDPSRVKYALTIHRSSERLGMSYAFVFRAHVTDEQLANVALQANEISDVAYVTKEDVLTKTRPYSKSVKAWAHGIEGYLEEQFG